MLQPKLLPVEGLDALTALQQDSLVNLSAWQVNGKGETMGDSCGPKLPVAFARLDQSGSCWRTFQVSFLSTEGLCLATVLRDLATAGYDAEWGVLSAASVGAPHIRERVIIVASPNSERQLQSQGLFSNQRGRISNGGQIVSDARCGRYGLQEGQICPGGNSVKHNDWWAAEPDMGRLAHGVSSRVDRLRCLGNAVVPQVAEWVGRRIIEADGR